MKILTYNLFKTLIYFVITFSSSIICIYRNLELNEFAYKKVIIEKILIFKLFLIII